MTYTLHSTVYNSVKGTKVSTGHAKNTQSSRDPKCIKRDAHKSGFLFDIVGRPVHPNTVNQRLPQCSHPGQAIHQENQNERPSGNVHQTFNPKMSNKSKYPKLNNSFFSFSNSMSKSPAVAPSPESSFSGDLNLV